MLGKSRVLSRWLRLPSLLLVLLTTVILVTTLPAATGDTTADRVLGQAVFTLNGQNFIDGAGLDFTNGSIGNVTEADGVAVDTSSTPQHLYIADSLNSRILGWNNAESFASGQPADLVIGQIDMLHSECDQPAGPFVASASNLCFPTGVAVDSNGDLYIADFENSRVLEYNSPYAAYAAIPQTCTAANPCQNRLSANLVFGQVDAMNNPTFTTSNCNGPHGQGATTSNEELCNPEGVSVNPTTHDLYVADATNSRVVVFLDPLAGGGMQGVSGHPGDETADYVFGQGGIFTTTTCNKGGTVTASTLCGSGFFVGGGGVGVDASGDVYIADTLNNRVLQFNNPLSGSPPVTTSFAANGVLGQTNFANSSANLGGSPTAKSLDAPIDVKLDGSGNLYVADFTNSRVLEFKTPAASTIDPAADSVVGQKNFVSNSCAPTSASCVSEASGVAIDSSGNVFAADLANNRVLEYGAPLLATGNAAAAVLGQAFFDVGFHDLVDGKSFNLPQNVTIDEYSTPNHIYVTDGAGDAQFDNRVLAWYDAKTFTNGQPADLVFGQPDFYHIAANNGVNGPNQPGPDTLSGPLGMTVDNNSNLYIADSGNGRVLEYNNPFQGFVPGSGPRLTTPGTPSGSAGDTIADRVFGTCGDFTTNSCTPSFGTASTLSSPQSLAFDPKNGALYVSDAGVNDVIEYDSPQNADPMTATTAHLVFGTCGGGFAANSCNTSSPTPASLDQPTGVAVDAQGNLFVADGNPTRLLMYLDPLGSAMGCTTNADGSGCAGDINADKVFGTCGGGFTANSCGGTISAQSLNYGLFGFNSVAVDAGDNLYAMDPVNSRAIVFPNAGSLSGSLTATKVFGQGGSFTTGNFQFDGITADSLGAPAGGGGIHPPIGVAVDSSCDAYIADTGNNRVLGYDQPLGPCGPTPTPTATSTAATATPTATATRTATATATATSTATATATATKTATSTATATATSTATSTATATLTATPTATATTTATPTATATATATKTATASATPTATSTATATATSTVTATPTATATATATKTATATATSTATATATLTATPTATATTTATPTATASATATKTATASATPTATSTATATATSTATSTATATATLTATPTATATTTATPTATASATATKTATPTATPTATSTATASQSATATATATKTATPTSSATATGTVTATPTATASVTATPTATATATKTATATATATSSVTSTATATATNSATTTATPTATSTVTATPTATSTVTATPTATATSTKTATATVTSTATGTSTVTATPTATASQTATATSTPTATATVTATPTATATATSTQTATATATPTATSTQTATSTATSTETATATATATGTASPTVTATSTQTATATPTSTATASSTQTATSTSTPTATATRTATSTETATATATATRTATASATPTVTATATTTRTATPTATATATRTATPTATSTPAGKIAVTPRTLHFQAAPNSTASASFTIRDDGSGDLHVNVGAPKHNPPFSIFSNGGAHTISSHSSLSVVIQYAPAAKGSTNDQISITSDDPKHKKETVKLEGKSKAPKH